MKDEDFKRLGEQGLSKVAATSRFFKYLTLHDGLEYVLKQNTFKFTDPEEFNDPFDCNERLIDIVISHEQERNFILEAGKKHNVPRGIIRKHIKRAGDPRPYQLALKGKKKDFKVSCFSEIDNNILMWSHYANSHRGVCLGFDLDLICEDYVLYPVNYIAGVQQIDGLANTPYVFYYWVTFKANCWAYEREIRAVSKNGKSIIGFPKAAVREVIFGCNVKQSTIKSTVKELKQIGYKHLQYYQMEINERSLQLKKKPLKF